MRIIAGVMTGLLLAAVVVSPQEKKEPPKAAEEFKIPPEEAQRQNPVKATPASIAEGKRMYGFDCAMCHGREGDGKGDLAASMDLKLRDWRDPAALEKLTDGEIYYIVLKGKGKMPGDEDRLKPEQCWNIINFVRSLAKKSPAPPSPPAKTEKPPTAP